MREESIKKCFATDEDLAKINQFSRRELTLDEVYIFTASLCDNDIDRDFERFSISALNDLAKLFIGKTGIADHSMKSSDQKARIFDAYVEKQEGKKTADGEPLFCLKARAYMLKNEANQAFIDEIDAGIKKEISVSCSMKSSLCSICGKDKKKERCEHISGKYYNGKLCYITLDLAEDAYEFSFVAVPAQRGAGVTKAFKITEEFNMDDIIKSIKSCDDSGAMLTKSQAKKLSSYIEDLEEEAKLGEAYKKELSKEVLKLFALRFPKMDSKLFSSVVSVMTAKELIGFKQGLEKAEKPASPQIMPISKSNKTNDYSQFRI